MLPVGYDEVFVIAVGLLEMDASSDAFWVEAAMQHSSGTAPLWWWIEHTVYRLAGELSLWGLRLAPVLLGISLLPLCYVSARHRFGRRAALWFAAFAACSDVLAFCSSRSDFFEPLLLVFLIPLVCRVGGGDRGVVRGLLWAGMGLTFFGKALFVIALCGLAEVVITALAAEGRAGRLRSLAVSLVVAAVPLLVWFGIAQNHYAGRVIKHEATEATNVWSLVTSLTLDYRNTKQHVTGSPRDAAQVWLDGEVWPLTALSIGPLICGLVSACGAVAAGLRRGWTRRRAAAMGLLLWVLVGVVVIVSRGTAGARFHLLYMPGLWLLAGLALSRIRWDRHATVLKMTLVTLIPAALAMGWNHWGDVHWSAVRPALWALVMIGLTMVALALARKWRVSPSRALAIVFLIIAIVLGVVAGPSRWAYCVEFEPMYGTKSLIQLDAYRSGTGPAPSRRRETAYLLLANYFLSLEYFDLQRAERFADLAVRDHPDDAASWFYLGRVYDAQDRPIDQRRKVWRRALDLKPDSELIRRRLQAVSPP